MALDVVGYSRLIREEEASTLLAIREHKRQVLDPVLKQYRGRLVKELGDGYLIEFASVVDAVIAAVEVQEATAERCSARREDKRLLLRAGVNVGDVIVEGGDLLGDGVNIASRLQELAEPGCVTVAASVYRELRGKLEHSFKDVGDRQLKNISEPVRVWQWCCRRGAGRSTDGEQKNSSREGNARMGLAGEMRYLDFVQTDDDEAYEYVVKGLEQVDLHTPDAVGEASRMFSKAISLQPELAFPYSGVAFCHLLDYINEWRDANAETLNEAEKFARKGVEIEQNNAKCIATLGNVLLWKKQHSSALQELQRAVVVNPREGAGYTLLGWVMHFSGDPGGGAEKIRYGASINPRKPDIHLHMLAQAEYQLGHYEVAMKLLRRRLIRRPESDISRVLLAASYAQLDKMTEARELWSSAFLVNPDYSFERRRLILPYRLTKDLNHLVEGVLKASKA